MPPRIAVRIWFSVPTAAAAALTISSARRARDHDDPVAVGEQVIVRRDLDLADLHRHVHRVDHPVADDVARRRVARIDRKAHLHQEFDVAAAAVDHDAGHALAHQRLAGQFAHVRDLVVIGGDHHDVAGLCLGEETGPGEQGLVRIGLGLDLAAHREHRARDGSRDRHRVERVRQREVPQPHAAHHVVHDAGVELGEARRQVLRRLVQVVGRRARARGRGARHFEGAALVRHCALLGCRGPNALAH